jgi:hypothetical protein
MSVIKSRLAKLEQKQGDRDGFVVATELDFFYGDISATRKVTKREFMERANRGLAGFYEDIAKREAAKAMAATDTIHTS